MNKLLALSVIIDGRQGDDKYAQAYVMVDSIIAMHEDLHDENCFYILLSSGHDMHVNHSLNDLKGMLNP